LQSKHGEVGLPTSLLWSISTLGQAVEYLAQSSGYTIESSNLSDNPLSYNGSLSQSEIDPQILDRWMNTLANHIGLECEPIQATHEEIRTFLHQASPALLQLTNSKTEEPPCFIVLLKGGRYDVQLIAHDGSVQRIRYSTIEDVLWSEVADSVGEYNQSLQQILEQAGVAPERHQHVQRALLKERVGVSSQIKGWLLRLPPSANLWHQVCHAGLTRTIINLVGSYLLQMLLTILAWWTIGESVLLGHFDWAWMMGWALILITTIPFQAWSNLAQSRLAIGIGAIFKQRLLHGILQLSPEEIRHQGAGQFLGRVLASDTVEQLGLASGFMAILALFQLVAAVAILTLGIGGWLHAILLLIWVSITVLLSGFYLRRSQAWMIAYREMTNDLVERMVGHRTRLAQEDQQRWHNEEDQILSHYFQLQKKVDGLESLLKAFVPRGWMLIGVGGLIYGLLLTQPTPTQVAISLGGILFAYQALSTVIQGLKSVVSVRLAWTEISTLFYASTRAKLEQSQSDLTHAREQGNDNHQMAILTARDVGFRYHAQSRSVLQNCNLQIYHGDRILLQKADCFCSTGWINRVLDWPNGGTTLLRFLNFMKILSSPVQWLLICLWVEVGRPVHKTC